MITLRPYQREGLEAIWQYYANGGSGNALLCWPTGTGKSIVPAVFIQSIMRQWPSQRILMITHVKELISQNLEKLRLVWPDAPVSVYSAGLKEKNSAMPIVFGGIQSMIKDPVRFGHRDIIFIDEAHLISTDEASQYMSFLAAMKLINPSVKIIGLTATPFRMGQGMITDGGIFTDIVHDLTTLEKFNELIDDGYLSKLIPLRTKTELDVSDVSVQKGEFVASSLQKAVDRNEVTYQGLREVVDAGYGKRRSWLLFSSGIEHAEHIAEMLRSFGIDCAAVHSKQTPDYNDAAIKAFKNYELQSIVNYGKLTTGFDHPGIDLIAMFRPTLSVPLWVQMLGRGTRPCEGKDNCIVLDFARNTPRLGPINDPVIPRKKGEGAGEVPVKLCEACGAYNHAKVRFCCQCGAEFEFKNKLVSTSGTEELLRIETPVIETFDVDRVIYGRHEKKDKKTGVVLSAPMVQVTYFCGLRMFKEFVCLQHTGLARHKAREWWKMRHKLDPPQTTDEALQYISELRKPRQIKVHVNKKWPEIVGVQW